MWCMSAVVKEEVRPEKTQAETMWNARSYLRQSLSLSCAFDLCQGAGDENWVGLSPQVRDCVGETVRGGCRGRYATVRVCSGIGGLRECQVSRGRHWPPRLARYLNSVRGGHSGSRRKGERHNLKIAPSIPKCIYDVIWGATFYVAPVEPSGGRSPRVPRSRICFSICTCARARGSAQRCPCRCWISRPCAKCSYA